MSYTITDKTLLLESKNKKTIVYEEKDNFLLEEPVKEIINYNCLINGSTLKGREEASKFLIGSTYKTPISLNVDLILIPTHSSTNESCVWINLHNIRTYKKCTKGTLIKFLNHKTIIIKVSFYIFDKQVLKATRLESALRGRNNKKYF